MSLDFEQAFVEMSKNRASVRRVGKDGWPVPYSDGYAIRRVKGIRRIITADPVTGEPVRDKDGVYDCIGKVPQCMLFGWKYEVIE